MAKPAVRGQPAGTTVLAIAGVEFSKGLWFDTEPGVHPL
jgi:hypothetical protein